MKASTIIILLVIVILALGFFYYSGSSDLDGGGLLEQEQTDPEAELASLRVLALLNQIKSLRINAALFQSPTYQTLQDNSVPVLPQNVGRANPFAPIGSGRTAVGTSTSH